MLFESEIFSLEFHLELSVYTLLSDVALDVEELLVKSELEGGDLSSLVERCQGGIGNDGSRVSSELVSECLLTSLEDLL